MGALTERARVRRNRRELDERFSPDDEPVIEPDLPIVDAHHHLWDRCGDRYLLDELLQDVNCGHNIRASVYIEADAMHRKHGPEAMRSLGETEFANGMAAMSASGLYGDTQLCAAISTNVDLRLGDGVRPVLEAHKAAAPLRLRGVRHRVAYEASMDWRPQSATPGLLNDEEFRKGYACLSEYGFLFEAWIFSTQLDNLIALADAFPETTIVLNHVGGLIGVGVHEDRFEDVLSEWRQQIVRLAQRPNVICKLGGLGMAITGFDFAARPQKTASTEIAATWKPILDYCIEQFGVDRCMFESNFPPDRQTCSYRSLWNIFKLATQDRTAAEREKLFSGTACRIYQISL